MTWPRKRPRLADVLIALLLIHVVWGVARIPGKVWGDRIEDVLDYDARGAPRYYLDNRYRQGAEAVEQVLAQSPEHAVVLWRGEWRNAMEFVAPLIAPRLLVATRFVEVGALEFRDRPLAAGQLEDGRSGVFVLVGQGESVGLEVRSR